MAARRVPLLALFGALVACSTVEPQADPGDEPRPAVEGDDDLAAELAAARGRWAESGIDDYDLTLSRICFCPEEFRGPVVVSVEDGDVTARRYAGSGTAVPPDRAEFFPTVEGLFVLLEAAIGEADRVTATFHPELGYPVDSYVDTSERIADEEIGHSVSALERR